MRSDKKSKENPILRLVVNTNGRVCRDALARPEKDETTQLEMFEQPNAIYFAAVGDLVFDDVKYLIQRHHFHHIVDLREVPYLNFGHSSRGAFFQLLAERTVDYLSLFSVASLRKKPSVYDLFDDIGSESTDLSEVLSHRIAHGPTLVLISKKREDDIVARSFSKFLTDSKIEFSEIAS